MTRIRAFAPTRNFDVETFFGDLLQADASTIVVGAGGAASIYRGSFSYSNAGTVSGELSGFESRSDGRTTLIADDFRVDAAFAAQAIQTGNADILIAEIQRGGDRIAGSGGGDAFRGYGGGDLVEGLGGADLLRGDGGRDSLRGGAGDDTLEGGSGDDLMRADAGRDRMEGGGGRDAMEGGGGADVLEGGAGADRLAGGGGGDALLGGAAADVFAFGARDGADTIGDFEDGVDRIELRAASGLRDLSISQDGADVLIVFSGTAIRLLDADAGDVTAADFLF